MDKKGQSLSNGPVEALTPVNTDNKTEYRKVYHLLDELGFNNHKCIFNEHQLRDSTLAYIESEEELKILLKEVGLPAGPVFAFVKLWFRYKNNPDIFQLDTDISPVNHVSSFNGHANNANDKLTQTTVITKDVATQTQSFGPYSLPQTADPHDMFYPYGNFQMLAHPMPIAGGLSSSTYSLAPWPSNPLINLHKSSTHNNSGNLPGLGGLVNGLADRNAFDPLENFNPHDNELIPLEKNGCDTALDQKSPGSVSSEYSLFPDTEPLCSPKTSHIHAVGEGDDPSFSRPMSQEHERDQRSYATALKDHKEGQQSLPNGLHSDLIISHGARSRSSSTASNNLSRSASSTDNHTVSPARESPKSPTHRPYAGVDDIDPQQKSNISKSCLSNPSFSYFYEKLPESCEYTEAMKEKAPKAGWRTLKGKHEKSGRFYDFKPQHIDKEGRVRHGVRVRGALKSMECWLHTSNKPPIDCLFAHSRIGDTLQYICIRCTVEKGKNYECRDKKGHGMFICNLGPYRDISGGKWRGKVEPSQ